MLTIEEIVKLLGNCPNRGKLASTSGRLPGFVSVNCWDSSSLTLISQWAKFICTVESCVVRVRGQVSAARIHPQGVPVECPL